MAFAAALAVSDPASSSLRYKCVTKHNSMSSAINILLAQDYKYLKRAQTKTSAWRENPYTQIVQRWNLE